MRELFALTCLIAFGFLILRPAPREVFYGREGWEGSPARRPTDPLWGGRDPYESSHTIH